jgi:hypothetical protein
MVHGWGTHSNPHYFDTWEYRGLAAPDFLVGQGLAEPNPTKVRIYDASGAPTSTAFLTYGARSWGVNVAAGRIDAGEYDTILTGPGPGPPHGPHARGFRRDGASIPAINYYAYGTLRYGLNLAAGDLDGDEFAEILTGPGAGVIFGPHVRGWNVNACSTASMPGINFFAYSTLRYGVEVAAGDVHGPSYREEAEILTAPGRGPTLAPVIRGWGRWEVTGQYFLLTGLSFEAFAGGHHGATVAAGDVDADGTDDILCARGPGPGEDATVRAFRYDYPLVAALSGYQTIAFPTRYGARPGSGDLDANQRDELVVGAGPDPAANAQVRSYDYIGGSLFLKPNSFVAFTSYHGVNVTGIEAGL